MHSRGWEVWEKIEKKLGNRHQNTIREKLSLVFYSTVGSIIHSNLFSIDEIIQSPQTKSDSEIKALITII